MARKLDPAKHEAKRQQILEAAITCFAQNGFHQTTTAQICAAVGMSSGNLFHYFDSKEAIIETIVAEERRETADYFAELGAADDQFGAILGFVDASLELATDPTYARLVLAAFLRPAPPPAMFSARSRLRPALVRTRTWRGSRRSTMTTLPFWSRRSQTVSPSRVPNISTNACDVSSGDTRRGNRSPTTN